MTAAFNLYGGQMKRITDADDALEHADMIGGFAMAAVSEHLPVNPDQVALYYLAHEVRLLRAVIAKDGNSRQEKSK